MFSSSTATCCAAPAATSTTPTSPGPWPGSGTRCISSARTARSRIEGVEIHNPDIGGLLPVYVKDPTRASRSEAFPELTDEELERYIEANVAAVRGDEAAGGVDAALANHLVMGPAILARAGIAPFAAKIHGSALEYTVKPHPRFLPYAKEGMEAASGVLVGSRHTAESLWEALPVFRICPRRPVSARPESTRRHFIRGWRGRGAGRARRRVFRPAHPVQPNPHLAKNPARRRAPLPATGPAADDSRVVFVGKLIVSKGVLDLLLAAWPLVKAAHPDAALQIVGFGEYEEGLPKLLAALERGDLATVPARLRDSGGRWRAGMRSRCRSSAPFSPTTRGLAGSGESIGGLGRVHRPAGAPRGRRSCCPAPRRWSCPAPFPEAFGMVAVEAAACGALPVSADHSGCARCPGSWLPPCRRRSAG